MRGTATSICKFLPPAAAPSPGRGWRRSAKRCARRPRAPARIVGSAAQLVADGLAVTDAAPLHVDAAGAPDIDWVARMGAALPEGQSPPKPQYLRAPDAQPQNAAQLPRR